MKKASMKSVFTAEALKLMLRGHLRFDSGDVDHFELIFNLNFCVVVIDVNDFIRPCPIRGQFWIFT
jgi:hypothetical protein